MRKMTILAWAQDDCRRGIHRDQGEKASARNVRRLMKTAATLSCLLA